MVLEEATVETELVLALAFITRTRPDTDHV